MDAFRFCPELFETRNAVLAALNDAGFEWLTHFSSIDPIHDEYGIEVCGIADRDDAVAIQQLLGRMFPDWHRGCLCYKDYGREPGWKAKVFRDQPRERETWQPAW